jgi:hypothetical protein
VAPVNVSFCAGWDYGPWDAAVAALTTSVLVGLGLVAVALVGVLGWQALSIARRERWRQMVHRADRRLRRAPRLHRTAAAYGRYVWYTPGLVCFAYGLLGCVVMQSLAAGGRAAKHAYDDAVGPATAAFVTSAADGVNRALASSVEVWAASLNTAIDGWEAQLDAALVAVADTLNATAAFQASTAGDLATTLDVWAAANGSNSTVLDRTLRGVPNELLRCTGALLALPIPDLAGLLPAAVRLPRVDAQRLLVDAAPLVARSVAFVDSSGDTLTDWAVQVEGHARFFYAMMGFSGLGLVLFGAVHAAYYWRRNAPSRDDTSWTR